MRTIFEPTLQMITQEEIDQFYRDVESLKLKFPNAEIKKATGYSSGNVSDILKKNREPSEEFLKAFYKKFPKKSQNVPAGNGATGNTEMPSDDLSALIKSNAELVLTLKSAQANIASCQKERERLISLVEANSNQAEHKKKQGTAMNESLITWLSKIGTAAGVFDSEEDGRAKIGNTTVDTLEAIEGSGKTQTSGKEGKGVRRQ